MDMSEIDSQNGKKVYESLLDSWGEYWSKWKCAPDILYINAIKHAELFKWSALGGHQILFQGQKKYIFNAEVESIVDFSLDFIWLEHIDIKHAVTNNTDYAEKIINHNFEVVDDGVTPETQKAKIDIPNEVLNCQ